LFKIELLDDRGGEIAACFFKESAEKFHPLLEVNQVYTFANGRLKVANKQYSSCTSDYEISFGNDADIRLCAEDANIGAVKFNFRKLDALEHAEPNSTVDVCGVVKRAGDVVELMSKKTGSTLFKRDLTLADDSGVEVVLTIWGDKAKEDDAQWQGGPVLGVKKCKVSDYNGVSLSTLGSSQLMFEPQVEETQLLHAWWAAAGASSEGKSLTQARSGGGVRDTALASRSTLAAIKESDLGHSEKGDFVTVKGVVDYILKKEGAEGPLRVRPRHQVQVHGSHGRELVLRAARQNGPNPEAPLHRDLQRERPHRVAAREFVRRPSSAAPRAHRGRAVRHANVGPRSPRRSGVQKSAVHRVLLELEGEERNVQ